MAKHIKRFNTLEEYTDYVSDSSFEPPLVSVCDELTDSFTELPTANFVLTTDITVKNPNGYTGVIYVTNEHEVLYQYNFGPVLKASKDSHILGSYDDSIDHIPYHKDLYYCWELHSLGGSNYSTASIWDFNGDEHEGEIMPDTNAVADYASFWNVYCSDKSISTGSNPYRITGYPGDYSYPTVTMNVGGSKFTEDYSGTLNDGDEIQIPIVEGFKLFPGATLIISIPTPRAR